ncbi:MAG TPA: hypothetical protein VFU43_11865 [Streptosporangiaceae bacterium]|nr:hypothetical protein [Streptosporangiaceae bacterium]
MRRPKLRVLLAVSDLLAVELHAAQQRWRRHERWGWGHRRQDAAEVVAEQLGRDLHA